MHLDPQGLVAFLGKETSTLFRGMPWGCLFKDGKDGGGARLGQEVSKL